MSLRFSSNINDIYFILQNQYNDPFSLGKMMERGVTLSQHLH